MENGRMRRALMLTNFLLDARSIQCNKINKAELMHFFSLISNDNFFLNLYTFFHLQSNLTHLPRSEYVPGIGVGIAKCPYDPQDNSTAVYVENGNPGGLPALVSSFFFSLAFTSVIFLLYCLALYFGNTVSSSFFVHIAAGCLVFRCDKRRFHR